MRDVERGFAAAAPIIEPAPTTRALRVREQVVTLTGTLPGDEQKRMAEHDAWYVPGVHDVVNRIATAEWERQDECVDEASRDSFPASDPPALTPIIGVGGRSERPGNS